MKKINYIHIHSPGDTSVGIWDFDAYIEDLDFDVDDYDQEDLEEVREHISQAFEILLGEKCGVSFSFEMDEYNELMDRIENETD